MISNDFQNPKIIPVESGNEVCGRDEKEYEMWDFSGR
jgi:hypothetical protein